MPTRRIPGYCKRVRGGVAYAYVQVNGRQRQLGRYGTKESRKRYTEILATLTEQESDQPRSYDHSVTLVEICSAYLPAAERYYSSGRIWHVKIAVRELLEFWGDAPAIDFGPLALNQLREQMIRKDWSRNYINDLVSAIKTILRWASETDQNHQRPARTLQAHCRRQGPCGTRSVVGVGYR